MGVESVPLGGGSCRIYKTASLPCHGSFSTRSPGVSTAAPGCNHGLPLQPVECRWVMRLAPPRVLPLAAPIASAQDRAPEGGRFDGRGQRNGRSSSSYAFHAAKQLARSACEGLNGRIAIIDPRRPASALAPEAGALVPPSGASRIWGHPAPRRRAALATCEVGGNSRSGGARADCREGPADFECLSPTGHGARVPRPIGRNH